MLKVRVCGPRREVTLCHVYRRGGCGPQGREVTLMLCVEGLGVGVGGDDEVFCCLF